MYGPRAEPMAIHFVRVDEHPSSYFDGQEFFPLVLTSLGAEDGGRPGRYAGDAEERLQLVGARGGVVPRGAAHRAGLSRARRSALGARGVGGTKPLEVRPGAGERVPAGTKGSVLRNWVCLFWRVPVRKAHHFWWVP